MKKISILVIVFIFLGVWFLTPLGEIFSYRVAPDFPRNTSKSILSQGVTSKVNIFFDDYGIPHIEAKNFEDLAFATGWVQARYRSFQMDILRRVVSGRLSEILGEQPFLGATTVEFDLTMRGWSFGPKATAELSKLTEKDKNLIKAYTAGINKAIKEFPSIEHRILGQKMESWKEIDGLKIALLQAWSITQNWEQEATRLALTLDLGFEKSQKLYSTKAFGKNYTIKNQSFPENFYKNLIPNEVKEVLKKRNVLNKTSSIISDIAEIRPSASNAWVVSGNKTQSGKPIIANDMHLTHALPSLIFLQHQKVGDYNAIGGSMPGIPFLIAGFNGHVAWGVTSALGDVIDLVVEKQKSETEVFDESQDCRVRNTQHEIKIKDQNSRSFNIRKTCHGVVFNDMYPKLFQDSDPIISLRFELPNVAQSYTHLMNANKSKTIQEMREKLMEIPSPVQNIMAADIAGNIAFFPTGKVPLRENYRGNFPTPGWLDKYKWKGHFNLKSMPLYLNPPQDYIINGNNVIRNPKSFKNLFHFDTAPDYRIDRIEKLIKDNNKLTIQDMLETQKDHYLNRGKLLGPKMVQALKDCQTKACEWVSTKLSNWDYQASIDSLETSIFFHIYYEAINIALNKKISKPTKELFFKQRYSTNGSDLWFLDPNHTVWDNYETPKKELLNDVIKLAAENTHKRLANMSNEALWGNIHYAKPTHPFGKKSILNFFNLNKEPLAGSLDSVWKAHFSFNENLKLKSIAGPAFRFIMDLGKPDEIYFSNDTGVSGHPLDPHYSDQYPKWLKGELVKAHLNWNYIEKHFSKRKITLTPQ